MRTHDDAAGACLLEAGHTAPPLSRSFLWGIDLLTATQPHVICIDPAGLSVTSIHPQHPGHFHPCGMIRPCPLDHLLAAVPDRLLEQLEMAGEPALGGMSSGR